MDLDVFFFSIFFWVWKWFWPKPYQNRKFLEFLPNRDLGGICVCFTFFFYDFGTVPYENRKKNVNKS